MKKNRKCPLIVRKMFIYRRTIHLRQTDATGVLYFPEQLSIALEALEEYFLSKGFTLQEMIETDHFFLPVVHAEADFKAPLRVGDSIEIDLSVSRIGTSSFTLETTLWDKSRSLIVGTTRIVHVAVSQETRLSIPLPPRILGYLTELQLNVCAT